MERRGNAKGIVDCLEDQTVSDEEVVSMERETNPFAIRAEHGWTGRAPRGTSRVFIFV